MTSKCDKAKPHNTLKPEREESEITRKKRLNPRKAKMADFLIDVAKFVFTGVLITSLFNDVSNKTTLYIVVLVSLWFQYGVVYY